MANRKQEGIPIDKHRFLVALKLFGWSIRKLGEDPIVNRTERTIRRQLNSGEMSPSLLHRISIATSIPEDVLTFKEEIR